MSFRSPVRIYCAVAFLAGCAAILASAGSAHFGYPLHNPLIFSVIGAGVLLGEMLPIKVPRRGNDEELTLSAAFAMALLMIGGLGPAVIAQAGASIIQDVSSGKPWWRVRFNAGQYALSLASAWVVIRAVSGMSMVTLSHPLASAQLPPMLLGAGARFSTRSRSRSTGA